MSLHLLENKSIEGNRSECTEISVGFEGVISSEKNDSAIEVQNGRAEKSSQESPQRFELLFIR